MCKEEKTFVCEVCMKSFKRLEHLEEHEATHIDSKLFPCSLCQQRFDAKHKNKFIQMRDASLVNSVASHSKDLIT